MKIKNHSPNALGESTDIETEVLFDELPEHKRIHHLRSNLGQAGHYRIPFEFGSEGKSD